VEQVFLASIDILRFSTRVYVRDRDMLSPAEDRVRLQPLLEDGRTVLGQKIQTESGITIGTCKDVQFDTSHFLVEWIFPKKLWKWGVAIPVSEILEVRKEAIIVRNPTPVVEEVKEAEAPMLQTMPEAA
jgi:sporulation protein YlmC with PRC-barrel domain